MRNKIEQLSNKKNLVYLDFIIDFNYSLSIK